MNFSIKEESNYQYIDEGKGEILLLLHGLFGALSNWEGVINLFPPPIETLEIIDKFFPNAKISSGERISYDYRTMATESGYWLSKEEVMQEMEVFINEARG